MTRDIQELIERLEKATADEQRELLIAAFRACFPLNYTTGRSGVGLPRWVRFRKMLDAEAYESAAMTLAGEDQSLCEILLTATYQCLSETEGQEEADFRRRLPAFVAATALRARFQDKSDA